MPVSESGSLRVLFLSLDGGTTYKAVANETEVSFNPTSSSRKIVSKTNGIYIDRETVSKDYSLDVNSLYTLNNASYHNSDELEQESGNTVLWKLDPVTSKDDLTPVTESFL